jgi:hypothetical protein
MIRILVAAALALALPSAALAQAVVQSMTGAVHVADVAVTVGHRVVAPASVSTGPGAQAFLQFEDGTQIVLSENSLLRVVDYRYASGTGDRAVFDLSRGGARVVTGRIAATNPKQFFFRLPQTQLTVERPADFTVALVNPAYITVNAGSLLSSNGYAASVLSAGSTSVIASNAAPVASIAASSLPPSAASAMNTLSVATVSAPGSAAVGVAAGAAGGAGIGFVAPVLAVGAAALAGVAAAAANENDAGSAPATTNH